MIEAINDSLFIALTGEGIMGQPEAVDRMAYLAAADQLEEDGFDGPLSRCLRWCGEQGRWPGRRTWKKCVKTWVWYEDRPLSLEKAYAVPAEKANRAASPWAQLPWVVCRAMRVYEGKSIYRGWDEAILDLTHALELMRAVLAPPSARGR
jgi:hypothetical protein